MRAHLIAVGERMPAWVGEGFAEYAKRLSRELPLQLVEISTKSRSREAARAIADEGAAILAAIPKSAHVVALDGRGKAWSSEELAAQLARWRMQGQDLAFVIGGPDGLAPAVLERAQQRWSLGPATLPHPLVRIVVAEQLYRAVSQLANHPYHRG
ncbi:MAG TPA: 23S rRNA (pseudouridine(1915)-N(3))-methyltransferase RlmH [Rudaea sp.]|nr:23S rRNA (pseudouridine(1915)-N(3))-methyltransferase RlmH [Rudaea sp.]HSC11840.1 23S rRNA (pseudouridine(1915)-N(3))-methyltransferase RlmH [Rhodanobacteraceae bacterium]